jgi:hypothetical protein
MKKIFEAIIYVTVFTALVLLFFSCNPEKVTARKDLKAVNRVLAKRPLLDTVGRAWLALNPCLNDSSTVYVKGDTLVFSDSVLIHDTDKVTHVITDRWYITKRVQTTVTKLMTVRDGQKERLLEQDLDKANKQVVQSKTETIQAQKERDNERKKKNLYFWLLIGAGALTVVGVILKLKKII